MITDVHCPKCGLLLSDSFEVRRCGCAGRAPRGRGGVGLFVVGLLAFVWVLFVGVATAKAGERSPALVEVTAARNVKDPQTGRMQVNFFGGSGICIDPAGYILTAEHCVSSDVGKPVIRFAGLPTMDATVLVADPHSDKALLKVESSEPLPWVYVADAFPAAGETVICQGFPAGKYKETVTKINRFPRLDMWANAQGVGSSESRAVTALEIVGAVDKGNSGGPIFNQRGEVVGIMSHVSQDRRSWTYGCGVSEVQSAATYCGAKGLRKASGSARKTLPKAYFIWMEDCDPCVEFNLDFGGKDPDKRPPRRPDVRAKILSICRPRWVHVNNAKKLQRKYGFTPGSAPIFLMASMPRALEGYRGADQFLQELEMILDRVPQSTATDFEIGPDNGIEQDSDHDTWFDTPEFMEGEDLAQSNPRKGLFPERQPQSSGRPSVKAAEIDAGGGEAAKGHKMEAKGEEESETNADSSPDPPAVPSDEELAKIDGVLLVNKMGDSPAKGLLLSMAENAFNGVLGDRASGLLNGRARVVVVFRRTQSEVYEAVCREAGVTGEDPVTFILLAPKTYQGPGEKLVEFVETKAKSLKEGALRAMPTYAFFERTEEAKFVAVKAALATPSVSGGGGSGSLPNWFLGVIGGQSTIFTGLFLWLWRKVHRKGAAEK